MKSSLFIIKCIAALVLAAAAITASSAAALAAQIDTQPPGSYVEKLIGGDVDGDGMILSDDALLILRHSLGLYTITGILEDMADVDNGGTVDAADALMVLRYSVGFLSEEGAIIGKEFSSSVIITDFDDLFG